MSSAHTPVVRPSRKAVIAIVLAGVGVCAVHGQAIAASFGGIGSSYVRCPTAAEFVPAAAAPEVFGTMTSKSEAILGGTESALDRIRNQQAGLAVPTAQAMWTARESIMAAPSGCGTAGLLMPSVLQANTTPSMPSALAMTIAASPASTADDSFLATRRIAISHTSFSNTWDRVSDAPISGSQAVGLVGTSGRMDAEGLQAVNRWVNRNITYGEDRAIWSQRDYWATAQETLNKRRGDCEDLAILKYQILVALGVDREDLFLTLARDLVRNADHAVLIVRQRGTYYLLDNATDAIMPANVAYDYRPTLSFNSRSAWIHGAVSRRSQPTTASYLSVSATPSPRVTGLSR
jgi:predicted transglutaminase-like cysteine proteinase